MAASQKDIGFIEGQAEEQVEDTAKEIRSVSRNFPHSTTDPLEGLRREKRLQMNRDSARKRRKRKREMLVTLEDQVKQLVAQNSRYHAVNEILTRRVEKLEGELALARRTLQTVLPGDSSLQAASQTAILTDVHKLDSQSLASTPLEAQSIGEPGASIPAQQRILAGLKHDILSLSDRIDVSTPVNSLHPISSSLHTQPTIHLDGIAASQVQQMAMMPSIPVASFASALQPRDRKVGGAIAHLVSL